MSLSEYGLYVPKNTPIHRLDARVKVVWIVLVLASSVVCQYDGSVAIFIYLSLIVMMVLAQISVKRALLLIVYSAIFFITAVLVWAAYYQHVGVVLAYIPYIDLKLTDVGLLVGTGKFFLIVNPITAVWISLITTKPYDLVQVSSKLGFSYKIGYTFLIALKLLPTFYDEVKNIIDVQKSRGLKIDSGNIFTKMMSFVPVFVPLMVRMMGSMRELSATLIAKSFGATKTRTYMFEMEWRRRDTAAMILLTSLYVTIAGLKLLGFSLAGHFAMIVEWLPW